MVMQIQKHVMISKSSPDDGSKPSSDDKKKVDEDPRKDSESIDQKKDDNINNINYVNAASINEVNAVDGKTSIELLDDPNMHALEYYSIFDLSDDDEGDYDLWSMRMEQYLTHTDYALWEVIMNGDAPAVASASTKGPIPLKTAKQKIARKNELKAKSTL
ncbi:hypothetical protein Tco_1536081 [Tanacetum coccineum]